MFSDTTAVFGRTFTDLVFEWASPTIEFIKADFHSAIEWWKGISWSWIGSEWGKNKVQYILPKGRENTRPIGSQVNTGNYNFRSLNISAQQFKARRFYGESQLPTGITKGWVSSCAAEPYLEKPNSICIRRFSYQYYYYIQAGIFIEFSIVHKIGYNNAI